MRKYYAAENAYGTADSHGPVNTWFVVVFDSKKARDEWVANQGTLTAQAIKRKDVTYYAENISLSHNCTNAPRPFSGEYWAIVRDELNEIPGYVGHVECVEPGEYYPMPEPFYSR